MELISECPLCSCIQFTAWRYTPDDFLTKTGMYTLMQCENCSLVFTNPRPNEDNMDLYYPSVEYISHASSGSSFKDKLYFAVQKYMLYRKHRLIQKLNLPDKKLLDFGSGAGAFLEYMKQKGYEVVGFEPSVNASLKTANKDIPVFNSINDLTQSSIRSFNCITLWHVLEHSHKPLHTIRYLFDKLQPGGFAIVAVPLHDSFDGRFYGDKWAAYDVPRHLLHFNPNSLIRAFEECGFTIRKVYPMPFDSYYISMMSEPTNRSFMGLFRAFFVASVSNISAFLGRTVWSSQIFIFQKPN